MNNISKIALMISIVFSQLTFATAKEVIVNKIEPTSYNNQLCRKISKKVGFATDEYMFEGTIYEMKTEDVVNDMVNELSDLKNLMVRNGDQIIGDRRVLCQGIYDDGYQHNAYAIGYHAIKIGKGIIKKIKINYGIFAEQMLKMVLFHEFAHSIQHRHRWRYFEADKNKRSKIKEMQADCMAAIFMKMQGVFGEDGP